MVPAISPVLRGTDQTWSRRGLQLVLATGLFATVFAGYAIGIFHVSGGVIWIPYYATVVGMVAACGVGYYRDGLVIAWLVTYTALLGYQANHAFMRLSHRSVAEQLAYFIQLDGLTVLGIEAFVLGSLAFALGFLVRWGVQFFTRNSTPPS